MNDHRPAAEQHVAADERFANGPQRSQLNVVLDGYHGEE